MAIGVTDDKHYKAIADVLRSYTEPDNTFTPSEMPNAIVEAVDKSEEAGRKSEYDAFWDSYQDYGNRTDCSNLFSGPGWNDETFKPKYDISTIQIGYMFFARSKISDFISILPKFEIKNSSQYAFYQCKSVTHLGEITLNDEMYGTFQGCELLKTIDKLIINWANTKGTNHNSTFNQCSELRNIVIEGEFRGNVSFQYSKKLTKASITSIVNAISNEVSGKTLTLSKSAVDTAFQELDIAEDGSINHYKEGSQSSEWAELIATKSNWNISLV